MTVVEEDFLLKDYELKVRYLSDHLQRMWTRFNFFVTIESALIGGKFLIASNTPSRELAITEILLSTCWYVIGPLAANLMWILQHGRIYERYVK